MGPIVSVYYELGKVLDLLDMLIRQTDTFSASTPSDYICGIFLLSAYTFMYHIEAVKMREKASNLTKGVMHKCGGLI